MMLNTQNSTLKILTFDKNGKLKPPDSYDLIYLEKLQNITSNTQKPKILTRKSKKDSPLFVLLELARKISSNMVHNSTRQGNIKLFYSGILPVIKESLLSGDIECKIESSWTITNMIFEADDNWLRAIDEHNILNIMMDQYITE